MTRFLSAGIAAAALFCAPAFAADMPMKAPVYKATPIETWNGYYIGLNGGYGWDQSGPFNFTVDNPCCVKPRGGFGGGQIGFNSETNRWVWGIEADIQAADIKKSVLDVNFGDTISSKVDWFGTLRGRIGYAFDPALVYFTAGLAYGNVKNSVSGPILVGAPYKIDHVNAGYVLGGGVEFKVAPNWTVKTEYQYINLGTNDPKNPAGTRFSQLGPGSTNVRDNDFHTVRIGLNYLFSTR